MQSESILERNAETREVSIYGDTVTEERGKHASACFQSGWQRESSRPFHGMRALFIFR
ncbi:hypothetical protein C2W59_02389 [Bacillus pumilus]|uniref:Uncharacterized protein n=1 Tax=Bacillus pumilus TaxID=1408 RepID=A0AB34QU41_BACPU|nr:hypothetical protein BAT_4145 [Bacillus pumilus ATCC 7061]KIL19483.1 hypothetical protein B4127_0540 [Bacillus pumilus]RAP17530.1 hypothetical protein C2W59_02389 [Bacillus pumilus]